MNELKQKIDDIRSFILLPKLDLSNLNLRTNNPNIIHDVHQQAGAEHYRLLCLFSTWFNDTTIYEIGTWLGAGTICLAYNKNNKVISYDTTNNINVIENPNMKFVVGDYKNDKELLNSPFIFVDVATNGVVEQEIYEYLKSNNYKGFTVWGGINLSEEMKSFWKSVTHDKRDLTRYGHYTGTGIIFFE